MTARVVTGSVSAGYLTVAKILTETVPLNRLLWFVIDYCLHCRRA